MDKKYPVTMVILALGANSAARKSAHAALLGQKPTQQDMKPSDGFCKHLC